MKHPNRIELVGTIKNVHIQRGDSSQKIKLIVETEDLREGFKLRLPVTVWENDGNNEIKLLTTGTDIHIAGKIRVRNQRASYRVEKTVRDVIANKVEIVTNPTDYQHGKGII